MNFYHVKGKLLETNMYDNQKIKFSIIIPTYNSSKFISRCLKSLDNQTVDKTMFEVLIIDDASSDDTVEVLRNYKSELNIRIFQLEKNGGPGIARNKGIEEAIGEWILFVDSDDSISKNCLSTLSNTISTSNSKIEYIGFDWGVEQLKWLPKNLHIGRKGSQFLFFEKHELLDNFLSFRMHMPVHCSIIKKQLIERHQIKFRTGFSEDIDFMYKIYQYAYATMYVDKILYFRTYREESASNTISIKHIEGFINAWKEIGNVLFPLINKDQLSKSLRKSYKIGLISLIAVNIKLINRYENNDKKITKMYQYLYKNMAELISYEEILDICNRTKISNYLITKNFIKIMKTELDILKKTELIIEFLIAYHGKSWSCIDIAHSLFLIDNQINTCGKTFFVNNEKKGNTKLLNIPEDKNQIIKIQTILNAKRELYYQINEGISNECDGCPYLEFKEWKPLNQLDIRYILFKSSSQKNNNGGQTFYSLKNILQVLYNSEAV